MRKADQEPASCSRRRRSSLRRSSPVRLAATERLLEVKQSRCTGLERRKELRRRREHEAGSWSAFRIPLGHCGHHFHLQSVGRIKISWGDIGRRHGTSELVERLLHRRVCFLVRWTPALSFEKREYGPAELLCKLKLCTCVRQSGAIRDQGTRFRANDQNYSV